MDSVAFLTTTTRKIDVLGAILVETVEVVAGFVEGMLPEVLIECTVVEVVCVVKNDVAPGQPENHIAQFHHNLVIIGADDANMRLAGQAVTDMGGGLVVVDDGAVVASLALPIAGLMSDRPAVEVSEAYQRLLDAAAGQGSTLHDPFMAMSFMALEVIPKLKLTDKGLVDVEQFQFVDLFV